jgi:hypothetical protein
MNANLTGTILTPFRAMSIPEFAGSPPLLPDPHRAEATHRTPCRQRRPQVREAGRNADQGTSLLAAVTVSF